jgi:two-component system, NtrC family, sensor kinase
MRIVPFWIQKDVIYNSVEYLAMPKSQMESQLKDACQLTHVYWAAWVEHSTDWELMASYGLNDRQRNLMHSFIQDDETRRWMEKGLKGRRDLIHPITNPTELDGSKVHVFSDRMTQRQILTGSDTLTSVAKRFWQQVAWGKTNPSFLDSSNGSSPNIVDLGIPYHLPEVLDRVMELVFQTIDCESGWLAVCSGDYLEIRAQKCCNDSLGDRISIEGNPLLRSIVKTQQGRIVSHFEVEWAMVPRLGFTENATTWVALPLLIRKRLIGLVSVLLKQPIPSDKYATLHQIIDEAAPSVEASITFSDLADHLGRMALLNDFAVTITSALDPEQIAQRLFALLHRTYGTDRILMVVLSQDIIGVLKFTYHDGMIIIQKLPAEELDISFMIGKGNGLRIASISSDPSYKPTYPDSQSALTIPMRFRRQLVGVLGLESTLEAAFTVYDEHLLMVVASHLAGLFENLRLRREAESKARNLKLIHEVIEQVIRKTDRKEITQIAAELMAQSFAYDLVVIALVDGPERMIKVTGMGGNAAELVHETLSYMDEARRDGIMMRVAFTGENMLVNDVTQSPIYLPLPNWDAGSEMCVALKDGDQTIGVIDVESQKKNAFSQTDLILLESLAGILSNVISSAEQYQKLQATVDQLRAAREELQERIVSQRMTESRLVQAAKLAAVGEMAAGIAHELNNPLTTVSGFTELVLGELPKEANVRSDLELVLKESQRARSVVRRLLDFSRQSESARARSDINEIITDVLALVNHLLHTSGVQLFTDLTKNLPWISVDRNQMKQVFLNIIHNALHAMPTGGELHITTTHKRRDQMHWLVIALRDTGIGIAPENIERVFEPFFTTRSKDGGTGLGLSVTYGIVTDHGGRLEVESEVGKGTSFVVWLPIEAV